MRCAAVVRSCAAATLAVSFSAASADVVWDEAIDGDLSDDYLAPTFIDVSEGSINVIFTTDQDGDDDDIFTFTIAEGYELVGFVLDDFVTDDPFNLAFISIMPGNQMPFDPATPATEELLGYTLFNMSAVGNDLFLEMGAAFGTIGYDGPLGAGDYTVWAQETSPSVDDWNINIVVAQVPAPGVLAVLGVAGLAARRRRA